MAKETRPKDYPKQCRCAAEGRAAIMATDRCTVSQMATVIMEGLQEYADLATGQSHSKRLFWKRPKRSAHAHT